MSPVLPGVVPANIRVGKDTADGAVQETRRNSPPPRSTSASRNAAPEKASCTSARSLSHGAGAASSNSVGGTTQAVPTVIFDLSTGTASARVSADRSSSSPTSPASRAYFLWREHADPALLEYYGNLLRAEHKERRNLEAMLNEELASHTQTRKEMHQREQQHLAEKKQLQQRSRDHLYHVQNDHVAAYRELEQEFEALREEHESLREKSKQQTLCQKSLLREVSSLLLEREALKKEVHRLTIGGSLSAASTPTQRGRRLSGGNASGTLANIVSNSNDAARSASLGKNPEGCIPVAAIVDFGSPGELGSASLVSMESTEGQASQKQSTITPPMAPSSEWQSASLVGGAEGPKRCQPRQHQHFNQQQQLQHSQLQNLQFPGSAGEAGGSQGHGVNRRLFQPSCRASSDATLQVGNSGLEALANKQTSREPELQIGGPDKANHEAPLSAGPPRGPSPSQRKMEDEKLSEYLRHMQGFPKRSKQERAAG